RDNPSSSKAKARLRRSSRRSALPLGLGIALQYLNIHYCIIYAERNSLPDLLWSANRLFPLVTIHREMVNPDTCKIGRVTGIGKSHVSLLEIGPDAVWDEKPTDVPLREITRVDFGGGYEDALHLVGGDPPRSKLK
ncbi:MAG TPA: hypothetical protein VN776_12780, partial [Terracidiphilus sp.]|nr:hypothetical protein [Terracidiphilus sp.]